MYGGRRGLTFRMLPDRTLYKFYAQHPRESLKRGLCLLYPAMRNRPINNGCINRLRKRTMLLNAAVNPLPLRLRFAPTPGRSGWSVKTTQGSSVCSWYRKGDVSLRSNSSQARCKISLMRWYVRTLSCLYLRNLLYPDKRGTSTRP